MSTASPEGEAASRSLRPWFLVAAMILTWLVGVHGVMTGCGQLAYLRSGTMPDDSVALEQLRTASDPTAALWEYAAVADNRALAEHGRVMLPVSIARALLSMLLVAASAMLLAGRPGSRGFAIQVLVANAFFAVIAYAVTAEVRAQFVASMIRAARSVELPPNHPFAADESGASSAWFWASRARLVVFDLGVLAVAGLAAANRRTRVFVDAVARAERRRESEDEP
ncbi:MAG: hypothetical protein U0271_03570 [Polyangiaceae bacterium]